ncbi:MAG: hypothetical protein LBV30_00395 [Propionibacteriaceae bacterium]|nr:hypothetical protein [Propionibacteriaceae bacterium]
MLSVGRLPELAADIDATFLEPAMGDGNFVAAILTRKLAAIREGGRSWNTSVLRAMCSVYGIELLRDNLADAHRRVLALLIDAAKAQHGRRPRPDSAFLKSADLIIKANLVQGNTLTRRDDRGGPIILSQWSRIAEHPSQVQRVLFDFAGSFAASDTPSLFSVVATPAIRYQPCPYVEVWKETQE